MRVRATPRADRDAVDGVEALSDGSAVLRVRVRAAPDKGAANEAVRAALAVASGRPRSAVALQAGATSRIKVFAIDGDPAAIAARLGGAG